MDKSLIKQVIVNTNQIINQDRILSLPNKNNGFKPNWIKLLITYGYLLVIIYN